ncbi:Major facilitator superfamily protein [Prunus dulcis]|uniref:Major facilitator superfamily protein n=1 Tax=Prunus dulcis TaxID=3755 RepID=A0A4Y1RPA0_PRUDU|nr:Major facilitator superfamily protein [Prunus dulcis]
MGVQHWQQLQQSSVALRPWNLTHLLLSPLPEELPSYLFSCLSFSFNWFLLRRTFRFNRSKESLFPLLHSTPLSWLVEENY